MQTMLKAYLQTDKKAAPPENPMSAIGLNGSTFTESLNYVIEMFLKQLEDLKCTEELFKEFCLKDRLNNFS